MPDTLPILIWPELSEYSDLPPLSGLSRSDSCSSKLPPETPPGFRAWVDTNPLRFPLCGYLKHTATASLLHNFYLRRKGIPTPFWVNFTLVFHLSRFLVAKSGSSITLAFDSRLCHRNLCSRLRLKEDVKQLFDFNCFYSFDQPKMIWFCGLSLFDLVEIYGSTLCFFISVFRERRPWVVVTLQRVRQEGNKEHSVHFKKFKKDTFTNSERWQYLDKGRLF